MHEDERLPAWCPTCYEPLTASVLVGGICARCGCYFRAPLFDPPDEPVADTQPPDRCCPVVAAPADATVLS